MYMGWVIGELGDCNVWLILENEMWIDVVFVKLFDGMVGRDLIYLVLCEYMVLGEMGIMVRGNRWDGC